MTLKLSSSELVIAHSSESPGPGTQRAVVVVGQPRCVQALVVALASAAVVVRIEVVEAAVGP